MKRTMAISLLFLLLAGCGGKAGSRVEDLQKSNEDLKARVKVLEDDLLAANKKLIQHDQALQAMHERLRQVESSIDKLAISH